MAGRTINRVTLLGNLGRDAETKFTASGVARTTFSIATSRSWKDKDSGEWKEQAQWTDCVLWRSEAVAQHLLKGKQVYLEGHLETRSWEDNATGAKRYATEVVVDQVILLGGGADAKTFEEAPRAEKQLVSSPRKTAAIPARPLEITDDDVPF